MGLDIEELTFVGTYWFDQRDMLMHGFIGFTHKMELKLSEEVDSAEWIPVLDAPKVIFPDKPGGSLYEEYHRFLKNERITRNMISSL